MQLPHGFQNEDALEAFMTTPYPELIDFMRRLEGDLMILGAGGKMGPTLARLARRACDEAGVARRIMAVSRYSDPAARASVERHGIEAIPCDLLDPDAVAGLPRARNIIFMAGRKFGEVGSETLTWMTNVVAPAIAARAFPDSRFVVFSTGCVYEYLPPAGGVGSRETDIPAPIGEYSHSCLGRERVFEYYSALNGTPLCIYRLNYSIDMRYGVLVDIAQRVHAGMPVDRSVAAFNVIWQGDAIHRALQCLEHASAPPTILNITGPEMHWVEPVAQAFAERFGRPARFAGHDSGRALLSDASRSVEIFGPPRVSVDTMIDWIADWISRGGRTLGKPTHFQVTDGQYLDAEPARP